MIAKDQFVDLLADFDLRLRIQQSRPNSLNGVARFAVEIRAYFRAERKRRGGVGFARNTSAAVAQIDQSVREELRQLRDEMETSLKDLERKISSVISEKKHKSMVIQAILTD